VAITGGTVSGLASALAIASGGTGATTAAAALAALGGIGLSASTLAATGYVKLSNGLILQWGTLSVGQDSSATATFSPAFTSFAVPVVSAVALSGSATDSQNTGYVSNGLSSLTIWNAADRTISVPWLAVGV